MKHQVSIVGAGPAGFALAADLESCGTSVLLYSHPNHLRHVQKVMEKGRLTCKGAIEFTAALSITCDMKDVVDFSSVIILTVPSTGQATVLQELKRFDLSQHIIIAIPGNFFSLIADAEVEIGHIVEINLSPYSCRMKDGELVVSGKKSRVHAAAFRPSMSQALRKKIQSIFPIELVWCSGVIEASLLNVNGVFHPLMMLMNAGRIESADGDFFLYRDGLTRSVANAMVAVDQVRMEIAEALGLRLQSAIEVSNQCYDHDFVDLVDLAQNSAPHRCLKAPSDMGNRNISEDVPDLLVAWHGLAEKLGIDASSLKAVIVLVEMATGVDYMAKGRNLRVLHLEHVSRGDLVKRFGVVSGHMPKGAVVHNSNSYQGILSVQLLSEK